jgi:hypothetical protein
MTKHRQPAVPLQAGRKLEVLMPRDADAWFEWARLHREGRAVVYERYGDGYESRPGANRFWGKAWRQLFFTRRLEEWHGCRV